MGRLLFIVLTLAGVYFCIQKSTERTQETELKRAIKDKVNLAYKSYEEGGLSGLISLSKERHASIKPNADSQREFLGVVAIDMVGQSLDESAAREFDFAQDDYFHPISVSVRISELSDHLKDTAYSDPDAIKKLIQPLIDEVASEKFGSSNYVIGEQIKIFVSISLNILKTSGFNELKDYSESFYQELHKRPSINLSMLEKCAAIDMTGGIYLSKSSNGNSDKYFSPEFTIKRIGPYFVELGHSMEEANQYLRIWEAKVRNEIEADRP